MFVCFLSLNFACTFIYDEQANNRLKNNESFNALSMMIHSRQKKEHDYINRFVYESKRQKYK